MGIKLNVGASPIWQNDEWMILDHKLKENKGKSIAGDAANIQLPDNSVSLLFNSHLLEHIPHFRIDRVLIEFARVLEIGGRIRILCPDLRKIAKAYVEKDVEFFKEAVAEDENIRTDLGYGGMFMNFIVSPGQDTVLLNRTMTEFIGGYAHLYSYDFEMLEIMLKKCGFADIKQKNFCESDIKDFQEPLHVVGQPPVWQNFNKDFYSKNNLIHEYDAGKYNINFKVTGFDRDPLTSLIIEAQKIENVSPKLYLDEVAKSRKNYNRYGNSLLFDSTVKAKLALLGIKPTV